MGDLKPKLEKVESDYKPWHKISADTRCLTTAVRSQKRILQCTPCRVNITEVLTHPDGRHSALHAHAVQPVQQVAVTRRTTKRREIAWSTTDCDASAHAGNQRTRGLVRLLRRHSAAV